MSIDNKTIVYKTTNLVNSKYYIGTHRCGKQYYCKRGKCTYLGSGVALRAAIEKYGKENFTREKLYEFDDYKDALKKETEIVTKEMCLSSESYNIHVGGGYLPEFTDDRIERLSVRMTGCNNPIYGGHSEEALNNMRKSQQERVANTDYKNPMLGATRNDLSERNRLPKKWMNNGLINKLATYDKIDQYLNEGFLFGKIISEKEKEACEANGKRNLGRRLKRVPCEFCGRGIAIGKMKQHHSGCLGKK